MAYEDTDYPGAIDTFRTQENIPGQAYDDTKLTTIFKEDFVKRGNALLAIENALGIDMLNVWPVGCVIEFGDSANTPASRGMPGTWARHCEGFAHVGYKAADPDFGAVGGTVGAKTHTLVTSEMPAHIHSMVTAAVGAGGGGGTILGGAGSSDTNSTGGDGAHNNIQPSSVIVCWERTV